MNNIPAMLGLSGVNSRENTIALHVEKIFQLVLVLMAVWLLILWYLQETKILPLLFIDLSNWAVWFLLFSEFTVLIFFVKNKKQFFKQNWLSLVIIILCFPPFWFHSAIVVTVRILRFFVLVRVLLPTYKTLVEILSFNRFGLILLAALFITIFGGLLISVVDPGIHTPWDGIWWAWETITTVGYGDVAPTTFSGRMLAIIVMIFGSALFSILTANLAAYFISKGKINKNIKTVKREEEQLLMSIQNMQQQLNEISEKLNRFEHKK